jgi:hypothetical protein
LRKKPNESYQGLSRRPFAVSKCFPGKMKITQKPVVVEPRGIEPLTSTLPAWRSPS